MLFIFTRITLDILVYPAGSGESEGWGFKSTTKQSLLGLLSKANKP